jgi:hypothetical protein
MAKVMDAIFRCCAGLDVHSKTVAVCVRRMDDGGEIHVEVRTFRTMTRDLFALCNWLTTEGVSHVAMESTGVFWKPIFNILEEHFQILLVNARHVKNVPGRKTDVKDCATTAIWAAARQFHSTADSAGNAGSDPTAGQTDSADVVGGKPHPQGAGRY